MYSQFRGILSSQCFKLKMYSIEALFIIGAVHKLRNKVGEGVNPCVTLWSDGGVKWSFWHYRGGGGGGGQFWAKMVLCN